MTDTKRYEKLKHRIFQLNIDERHAIDEANRIEKQLRLAKKELQEVCPHETTKIVDDSYEDSHTQRIEWREKICNVCGKVIATSNKQEVWTEFS